MSPLYSGKKITITDFQYTIINEHETIEKKNVQEQQRTDREKQTRILYG